MKKGRSNSDKVEVSTKTKPQKERPMNQLKYIGMDVHKAMTVIAVRDNVGKVIVEAVIETKAQTILDFIKGQRGTSMSLSRRGLKIYSRIGGVA
jgi:hypothetical protein